MNLFLIGCGEPGRARIEEARGALDRLVQRLPFFASEPLETWVAPSGWIAATWVAHSPRRVGGVSYAAMERERVALWSGRPVLWDGNGAADGRSPLDPSFYLKPSRDWAERLDGRCTVVRCDDRRREVEVFSDAMGAYPVFVAEAGDATWISNSAELLRSVTGHGTLDASVVAALLGGGWSLSGDPVWQGVRRLPRAGVHTFSEGRRQTRALLTVAEIVDMVGQPLDVQSAASDLVANMSALADWPGRPNIVPATAGRDSRLVIAAALAAGIDFHSATGGAPDDPDVVIGRLVAQAAGVRHEHLGADPHGSVMTDWRRAAELVALQSSGTASLADAAGFPHGPHDGPLPLWHSGQGGEIARGYYARARGRSRAALAGSLYRVFVSRRPGRVEPLNPAGEQLVRAQVAAFVDEVMDAGAKPGDVPDLFYLLRRMGTWAGPGHGAVEFVRDTTSPLWSVRLLRHELAGTRRERASEVFHLRLLERLAPKLVDLPFAGHQGWAARDSELIRRARRGATLVDKGIAQLQRQAASKLRRVGPRIRRSERGGAAAGGSSSGGDASTPPAISGPPPNGSEPFVSMRTELRELALSQPGHLAWELLDAKRVDALLTRDPATLDEMSRLYVWRLATVFGAPGWS